MKARLWKILLNCKFEHFFYSDRLYLGRHPPFIVNQPGYNNRNITSLNHITTYWLTIQNYLPMFWCNLKDILWKILLNCKFGHFFYSYRLYLGRHPPFIVNQPEYNNRNITSLNHITTYWLIIQNYLPLFWCNLKDKTNISVSICY